MRCKNILITATLIFCVVTSFSQEVEVVRMEVERGIPGESFSNNKIAIDFWVKAADFNAVDGATTELLEFKDDTGRDLIAAHEEAIAAYEAESKRLAEQGRYRFTTRTDGLLPLDQWKKMYDTIGFKAVLKTEMALPDSNASKVYVKMKVGYSKSDGNAEAKEKTVTVASLYENPTVELLGTKVKLMDNSSMTRNDEKFIFYQFPPNETPVSIIDVQPYVVDEMYRKDMQGNGASAEFLVKEGDNQQPITLKITYREVEKKSITIDRWITVGL
ncbi:hypothetical protein MG296_07895 [Flavobacteriaceae bacterium TK19130]|nr:hypothetical protein [Thermobacterium salinum]